MKKYLLLLGFLSFFFSSCGPKERNNDNAASDIDKSGCGSEERNNDNAASDIDRLIVQHDQDMDQSNEGHKACKHVLQSLKDGTMSIDDAFIRSGKDGGKKCQAEVKWGGTSKPTEWQTFLIHIVELGCTPGDHTPYFEYAKANNANFKIWDMYGRSLLHLVLYSDIDYAEKDLPWLLENTNAKDLIGNKTRVEGDPTKERDGTTPLEITKNAALQAILRKHGAK